MDKMINLRIHHFYDILRSFGQNKKIKPHPHLHSFHKVAELVRHNPNLKIKITISCDSICENCIHYKNGTCDDLITHRKDFSSKEALNNYIDKRIMKKCLLKKGDILTVRQLCEKAELYLDNIEFIYSGNDLGHTKKRKNNVIDGLKYYNKIMVKNKKKEKLNKGEIIIYKTSQKEIELRVRLEKETIWLDAHQMAQVFNIDRTVIVKHIGNIYKSKELRKKSTCVKIAQVAADGKIRQMNLYNLDMVISVGYRINSQRATQFRIWATRILKQHILQGYTINEKRLLEARNKFNQLREIINFLQQKSKAKLLHGQEKEILNLLANYSKTLTLLEQYDKSKLETVRGKKSKFILEYDKCLEIIVKIKKELVDKKEAGELFGSEVSHKLESVAKNLYQTFDSKELYKTIEEKAANLLYLIIKDHPFVDGNKRIGSFLFVYFLDKNNYLYRETGEKKINDNALTALALLIAQSEPREKDQMIALITQLLK